MASDSRDLGNYSYPTSGRPIHEADPYVIVKFNKKSFETTPELLRSLYDISIDRFDEATDEEMTIILAVLPSVENLPKGARDQPVVSFRRVFESIEWDDMQALKKRKVEHPSSGAVPAMPDLETYFRIGFKEPRPTRQQLRNRPPIWEGSDRSPDAVATALSDCDQVDRAFVGCSIGAPPSILIEQSRVRPTNYDAIGLTEFKELHGQADGRLTQFVDIEQGWEYEHPDLPELPGTIPISGVNRNWIWSNSQGKWVNVGLHGLMVLGLIAGRNGLGIAPGATPYLASEWKKPVGQPWTENTAEAILAALMVLGPGDVIVIEGQQRFSNENLPVEADEMIFQAIVAAHHLGITVVEAAGNNNPNGKHLDNVPLPGGRKLFAEDSGAIVVAAGVNPEDTTKFSRGPESNYGQRIDCFADGDSLWVLDTPGPAGGVIGDYELVAGGGTSSASAIIAGVALLVQGLAREQGGFIHPWTLRETLRDKDRGTQPATTGGEGFLETTAGKPMIGVMPNLSQVQERLKDLVTLAPEPPEMQE